MKNKCISTLIFNLAIVVVVLSGCGKAKLEADNAGLKANLEKLQQQLQASSKQIGSQQTKINDLQSQLEEAKKRADQAENEAKSIGSQLETLKESTNNLMENLSELQKDKEKAEKDLEIYRDKATSAVRKLKALRSALDEPTIKFDGYSQNYSETKMAIARSVDAIPESAVKRKIMATLQVFTDIKNTWESANEQMSKRTEKAQSDYDRYVRNGGSGASPNQQIADKVNILTDVQKENVVTGLSRDLTIGSDKKEIDQDLKNLQDLINGRKS